MYSIEFDRSPIIEVLLNTLQEAVANYGWETSTLSPILAITNLKKY